MNLAGGLGTPEAAAGRASGRRDAPSRVEGTTTIRSGSARACGSDDDQGTRPSPIAEREKAAARFSVIPRLQALRAWPRQPVHRFLNRSGCGDRCPTRVISAGEHDPRESHARARGRTHPTRPPTTDPDTSARSNRARPRDSDPWEWSVDRRTPSRGSKAPDPERSEPSWRRRRLRRRWRRPIPSRRRSASMDGSCCSTRYESRRPPRALDRRRASRPRAGPTPGRLRSG